MVKEKKRKLHPADAAPPPADEGEGRSGRKGKTARKEKAEAILPSQIKNKDKHREVHAKLKREKKAQKRGQATHRAEDLGEQPPERQVPRTIENTWELDETVGWPDDEELLALDPLLKHVLTRIYEVCCYNAEQSHKLRCDLHEMKTHLNLASDPLSPLRTFRDPFEEYHEATATAAAAGEGPSTRRHGMEVRHNQDRDEETEEDEQEYQELEDDYDDDDNGGINYDSEE